MPDELDDKLRDAMRTLDEHVPSGYFDGLPNQILTRLSAEDGSSMDHGMGSSNVLDKRDALTGPPSSVPASIAKPDADKTEITAAPTARASASASSPPPLARPASASSPPPIRPSTPSIPPIARTQASPSVPPPIARPGTASSPPSIAVPAIVAAPVAPAVAAVPVVPDPPVVAAEAPAPSVAAERDEDSGLHDIRNLAQSTKQRLSKKHTTVNPPLAEDVLASSSGSWKNIALPEPAKMVSLPELSALPSIADVRAAEKAADTRLAEKTRAKARGSKKADAPSDELLAPVATANAALDSLTAKPAAYGTRAAFSLPSQQQKRSKGPLFAILGLGAAAAAGGLIFSQMSNDEKPTPSAAVATADTAKADEAPKKEAPKVEEIAPAAAPDPAAGSADTPAEPAVVAAEDASADDTEGDEAESKASGKTSKRGKTAAKGKKAVVVHHSAPAPKVEEKKVEDKKPEPKKTGKGDEADPSFDALLKEAGVEDKKAEKPKLEKKSLNSDDFKKAMSGISSKAQACYKGNQGTAMVKLTVAPTGKVSKVTVAGPFAGTPEGSCVESAVKSASFPPWDGGPQSFTYSYMLAD